MLVPIEDILSDIESERCVLIIGPDLIDFGGKSFFEALCAELTTDPRLSQMVDLQPQHIFMNDEMLQLKPGERESSLFRFIEGFYKKQNTLDLPISKIAKIKFHLILSLIPDNRITNVYDSLNLPYQFGYFPREENPAPVEKPTKEKPLIYNLLGNFQEEDYIVTFDHLFTYLSGIMGKREMPQTLQETIKKANSFIFLGVQFERWYVQLLLRIISNSRDGKDKLSLLKTSSGNEMRSFITQRLDLKFLEEDPTAFLDEIYDACDKNGDLKIAEAKKLAKVFISYNHKDAEIITRIKPYLEKAGIEYLQDERDMPAGEKIKDFVSQVQNVDCVLSVVSENSLLSAWVSQETQLTLQQPDIFFLPCTIDNTFMDKTFPERAEKHVDAKIAEIDEKIIQRGKNSTDDLLAERKHWETYWKNLAGNLNEITQRKCVDISPANLDANMPQVVDAILQFMKKNN